MKRLPLVFLSLFILVTCVWLASSNPRVGMAATNRAIPYWFGNTTYGIYADHACKDGIVVWATTHWKDDKEQYPTIDIGFGYGEGEGYEHFSVERDLDRFDGVDWTGQWIIEWPREMSPGERVHAQIWRIHRSSFPEDDYHYFPMVVGNCYVPEQPEPESIRKEFSCEFYDYETCEIEFKERYPDFADPAELLDTTIYEIPIARNGPCRVTQLTVEDEEIITDIDLGMYITSAPAALHSISLTSPQGTKVQLIDKEDTSYLKAAFRHGSRCTTTMPSFVLDDDSIYELADGVRPFASTSFKPVSGQLSDFDGENPKGVWTLEVCNIDASVDQHVNIGGNMDFEKGGRWVESSPRGIPLILNRGELAKYNVVPHGGNRAARLGGADNEVSSISQTINAQLDLEPHDPVLHMWYRQESNGLCGPDFDQLEISTKDLEFPNWDHERYSFDLCQSNETNGWEEMTVKLTDLFIDQYYDPALPSQFDFKIEVTNDSSHPSSVYLDDLTFKFSNEGSLLRCWALDISSGHSTLNVMVNGQGIVQKYPDSSVYGSGDIVSLTADPDDGHVFSGWSGDASGTTNPIQITMDGNKSVTASFVPVEPNTYTLEAQSSSGGSINLDPAKVSYQSGEVVTLTADPNNGYVFDGWGGDASGTANPIQITMDGNKFVTATFRLIDSTHDYVNFAPVVITN